MNDPAANPTRQAHVTDPASAPASVEPQLVQDAIDRSPFNAVVRTVIDAVDPDSMTISATLPLEAHHMRVPGSEVAHGGVIAAFADTVAAALCAVIYGGDVATIGMTVNYLAAATGAKLKAVGTVRQSTVKVAHCEVVVSSDRGPVALVAVQMRVPEGSR